MLKKYLLVFAFFIILAGVLFVLRGDEDTWFCQNNQWVKHGNPSAPMPDAGCGAPMNSNPDKKILAILGAGHVDDVLELVKKSEGINLSYHYSIG